MLRENEKLLREFAKIPYLHTHTYHAGPSPLVSPNNNSIFNLLLFIRITVVLSGPMCKSTLQTTVLGDFSALEM